MNYKNYKYLYLFLICLVPYALLFSEENEKGLEKEGTKAEESEFYKDMKGYWYQICNNEDIKATGV